MNRLDHPLSLLILLIVILQSCSFLQSAEKEETNPSTHQTTDHAIITTEVDIQGITKMPFDKKLIVNGTIEPSRASQLKMDRGGLLKEFNLVNGGDIALGQLIAQLEQQELEHDLSLLKADYVQVKLDRDE